MDVLADSDPRWGEFKDGFGHLYNPLPVLKALSEAPYDEGSWRDFWRHLYHQGDVGSASYVVVVALFELRRRRVMFDWNFYALLASVEVDRCKGADTALPDWLRRDYSHMWTVITAFCVEDMAREPKPNVLRGYLAVLALAQGNVDLGHLLIAMDEGDMRAWLADNI